MWLILSLSSLSIKACLYALSKLVSSPSQYFLGVQEFEAARALFAPIRPNLSKEILVTQRERGLFPSQQDFRDLCRWRPSQRRIWCQNNGCILLFYLSIIDDYHYGSTLIVLCLMLSYIFSDWYIIASTRFYACFRVVLCMCRYLITEIVWIVTGQSKGTKATSLRRTLALEFK